MSTHPPIMDARRGRWTWRGSGYALESQPDTDWQGRPWTLQADTIREVWGEWQGHQPLAAVVADATRSAA